MDMSMLENFVELTGIDLNEVAAKRRVAAANMVRTSYIKELGKLLGGRLIVMVDFDFKKEEGSVGANEQD